MPYPNIRPEPDFGRLEAVFSGKTPDRVPFIEFYMDFSVIGEPINTDLEPERYWKEEVERWLRLGYDGFSVGAKYQVPRPGLSADDTASEGETRSWRDEGAQLIASWQDLEQFPWPKPTEIDYSALDHTAAALPDGMGLIGADPGGALELAQAVMGIEGMSYAMVDDPDLVQAVFDRCGELMLEICRTNASHEAVGAVILGDDMGFKTQTIISPEALRRYLFPWHKRIAEAVHAYGKPLLLHSCGRLDEVMDDLIDDVGIDAKHSFEDVITPVTEAKKLWGDRIALLGGVDMDLLARGTPERVRQRTREILDLCMPGGGYALGSGNSIANYVRGENYLAMLEEGLASGVY